ncbi:MAG: c-type cytochrome [Gammaproteobacteria bacterium]|nr:c-type cytochrome [Gammaproteobacteria bacterium]
MNKKTAWVLAAVLSANLGVLSGLHAAPAVQTKEQSIPKLYQKYCSICHGDKGNAQTRARSGMTPKPRDFSSAKAAIELTRERMIKAVTEGRPGTAMVGHKRVLSEEQIAGIVDYIRANFMQLPVAEESSVSEPVSPGEKVYVKNCRVCHGDKGNTSYWAKNGLNPPPRDFTASEAQRIFTRQRMINSITHGRPGTGMMPFNSRLSEVEIAAVVRYIRFAFMGVNPDTDTGATPLLQVSSESPSELTPSSPAPVSAPLESAPKTTEPSPPPVAAALGLGMPGEQAMSALSVATPGGGGKGHMDVDMSLPFPNDLAGDFAAGREFYMKNCFTCHGVKGNGNGPRAYFNTPRPRDFTSTASRQILNRPRLLDGITKGRPGTVMPAWGKVLSPQEVANVAEFVFQTFVHPAKAEPADGKGPSRDGGDAVETEGKKKAG